MRHGGLVLIGVATWLGCGGGTADGPRARPTGPDIGAPAGGNGNHVAVADDDADDDTDADAGTAAAAVDEILVSGRGFMPQPVVRTGAAGATDPSVARDGSSFDGSCIGTFPSAPQHVVKLGGPIDVLRVLVDSDGNDLTLAVRTPDGVWHCNDDSQDPMNSLNPTVELDSPPAGQIEIWVGTYSAYYSGASYTLGVTEQMGYASALLRH